ncbi:hypothetical protein [Leptothermofonsia sp. ETS-13]|uniref:hypothetical protein n=1 Tax=Leptothermofonsia sp. ETS-13 TaxID=3035696 RepID=UPI003BA1CA35
MPGFLLHQGATVLCAHGGQAQLTPLFPRVKVMGQAVVLQILPSTIAGCTNPPHPLTLGPAPSLPGAPPQPVSKSWDNLSY